MKRIIITIIIAAVAAFAASAQAPTLERSGRFLSSNGVRLSDQEVRNIISPSVYSETYEGARKQMNAGRKLRTYGLIGFGVGLPAFILGGMNAGYVEYYNDYGEPVERELEGSALAWIGFGGGLLLMTAGLTAVEVSIPLTVIGKKRLDWVAEDYNYAAHGSSAKLDLGAQEHGFGLALKF
ncbi:MAG: hypothetical protein MJZ16_05480 [Bacteroidales bacterium]|nr:hypothetical protein [Bacteroidales bacterium]